eukprot:1136612-Rhodomonas_salina.2
MSGTGVAYAATRCAVLTLRACCYQVDYAEFLRSQTPTVRPGISLRSHEAMSVTGIPYGAMQYPVLTRRLLLPDALRDVQVCYKPTRRMRCPVLTSHTALCCQPTGVLCDVRY